jgi:hypothetical protein
VYDKVDDTRFSERLAFNETTPVHTIVSNTIACILLHFCVAITRMCDRGSLLLYSGGLLWRMQSLNQVGIASESSRDTQASSMADLMESD